MSSWAPGGWDGKSSSEPAPKMDEEQPKERKKDKKKKHKEVVGFVWFAFLSGLVPRHSAFTDEALFEKEKHEEPSDDVDPNHKDVKSIPITKVVMAIAIICNLFIIATAVVGIIVGGFGGLGFAASAANYNARWAIFFFCIGLIVFGIFGIIGELRVKFILKGIRIFYSYWTRAIWYFIMGFFAAGVAGALGLTTAIVCWLTCIMFVVLWFAVHCT